MSTATKTKRSLRHVRIDEKDIKPRIRAKRKKKEYKIRWARATLGTFMREQMFLHGYFVGSAVVKERNPNAGYAASRDGYVSSRGKYRGVWAWKILSLHSGVSVGAIKNLAFGKHKRSPEFLTVIRVFKALGIELVGVQTDDFDAHAYVRAF